MHSAYRAHSFVITVDTASRSRGVTPQDDVVRGALPRVFDDDGHVPACRPINVLSIVTTLASVSVKSLDPGVRYTPHTSRMATDETMGIGRLARASGVGVETLRYYERIGLLVQPGRRKGAYRRYGPDAVARLRFIRRAALLGFSLAETRELLALRAREGAPCAAVRAKASAKLALVEQKLAELTELRDAVAALVRACRGDKAVEHCTILAALGGEAESEKEGASSWPTLRPRVSPASKRARGASKTV